MCTRSALQLQEAKARKDVRPLFLSTHGRISESWGARSDGCLLVANWKRALRRPPTPVSSMHPSTHGCMCPCNEPGPGLPPSVLMPYGSLSTVIERGMQSILLGSPCGGFCLAVRGGQKGMKSYIMPSSTHPHGRLAYPGHLRELYPLASSPQSLVANPLALRTVRLS